MMVLEFVCEDAEVHRSLHYLREEQDAPRQQFFSEFLISSLSPMDWVRIATGSM